MRQSPSDLRRLSSLIAAMRDTEEVNRLLAILLTNRERSVIAERWAVLTALARGLTHREAAARCDVSISKITRGARALQEDEDGIHFLQQRLKKVMKRRSR